VQPQRKGAVPTEDLRLSLLPESRNPPAWVELLRAFR
jgi:hypothetical protein